MTNHKSREELLAEMQALRDQLAGLDAVQPDAQSGQTDEPSADGKTRRQLLQWVAPVVLASSVLPRTLYAQGLGPPTGGPPPGPAPIPPPSAAPPTRTAAPTAAPPTSAPPSLAPSL